MAVRRAFKSKNKNKRKPFDISVEGEVFTVRGGISGTKLLDLISKFSSFGANIGENDTEEEVAEKVDMESMKNMKDVIFEFFEVAVVKEDRDRFFDFVNDVDNEIELELLMEVMSGLMEMYSSRPLATQGASTEST